jgi:hypothetical protein
MTETAATYAQREAIAIAARVLADRSIHAAEKAFAERVRCEFCSAAPGSPCDGTDWHPTRFSIAYFKYPDHVPYARPLDFINEARAQLGLSPVPPPAVGVRPATPVPAEPPDPSESYHKTTTGPDGEHDEVVIITVRRDRAVTQRIIDGKRGMPRTEMSTRPAQRARRNGEALILSGYTHCGRTITKAQPLTGAGGDYHLSPGPFFIRTSKRGGSPFQVYEAGAGCRGGAYERGRAKTLHAAFELAASCSPSTPAEILGRVTVYSREDRDRLDRLAKLAEPGTKLWVMPLWGEDGYPDTGQPATVTGLTVIGVEALFGSDRHCWVIKYVGDWDGREGTIGEWPAMTIGRMRELWWVVGERGNVVGSGASPQQAVACAEEGARISRRTLGAYDVRHGLDGQGG